MPTALCSFGSTGCGGCLPSGAETRLSRSHWDPWWVGMQLSIYAGRGVRGGPNTWENGRVVHRITTIRMVRCPTTQAFFFGTMADLSKVATLDLLAECDTPHRLLRFQSPASATSPCHASDCSIARCVGCVQAQGSAGDASNQEHHPRGPAWQRQGHSGASERCCPAFFSPL